MGTISLFSATEAGEYSPKKILRLSLAASSSGNGCSPATLQEAEQQR